jgi:hypothetical protein
MFCGLDDGILFRMETTAQFMTLSRLHREPLPQTADFEAVGDSGRSTVIAGGEDILVLDQHCTHMTAKTGGTSGNKLGDLHEIFIPGRSFQYLFVHDSYILRLFPLKVSLSDFPCVKGDLTGNQPRIQSVARIEQNPLEGKKRGLYSNIRQ